MNAISVLRYAGYALFFVMMLLFGLYLTFPWDAAKDSIFAKASQASGMTITAAQLEPSWLTGFVARDLKITPAGSKDPIAIEKVTARAKLLAFLTGKKGVTVAMPLAKGEVNADVVLDGETALIKAETKGVELGLVPGLVDAIGMPLTGNTNLKADLALGLNDPKLTAGNVTLKVGGLKIEKGGKVSGLPIPELAIGDLDWQIPIEAGRATFKALKVNGDSVEAVIDGTIALLNPLARSNANLTVSFKPTDKLLKAEPLLSALLNNIQQARGADGFYSYAMTGSLKSPFFMPKRR